MKLNINNQITSIIRSRKPWNDTNIEIQSGEEYKFEAKGFWIDFFKKCDADGFPSTAYLKRYDFRKRSPENNWFALMGSLDKSTCFLIGKNNQITFTESGKLSCFANDVKGFYWNNIGTIKLTITRIK